MSASRDDVREWAWAAHPELLAMGAAGPAPSRAVQWFGSVVGVDLGTSYHWSVQLAAGRHLPDEGSASSALHWARNRDRGDGWCVSVPESLVGRGPWTGLQPVDALTMWAIEVEPAARLTAEPDPHLELDVDPSLDDVLAAYGGWTDDPALARKLVQPADLARAGRRFIIARIDGVPVGCAFVWWAVDTAYLSGIGVIERFRGRGIGYELTKAAARIGARGLNGAPPRTIWMHATDEGATLYSRMGFVQIDTAIQVGPA